jgi:hypothetical protein
VVAATIVDVMEICHFVSYCGLNGKIGPLVDDRRKVSAWHLLTTCKRMQNCSKVHSFAAVARYRLGCCMAKKKREPVDDLLDALVWMRRKAKKHEPVDDLVDALVKMRRKARMKLVKRKRSKKKRKPS